MSKAEPRRAAKAAVWLALLLSAVGCGGSSEEKKPLNVVHVTANVVAPTSWTSDNLYVVDNSIQVSATLTIAPGTLVKLTPGVNVQVVTGGAIIANAGSASTPIVFTSLLDDGRGGDTNGDGVTTAPDRGDWGYVAVTASGSVFNHCLFLFGGANAPYTGTLTVTNAAGVTITNCTFADDAGGTPADPRAAALNLGGAGAGTVLTGNVFYGDDLPLVVNRLFGVDGTNLFHATVAGVLTTSTYQGIFFDGPYSQAGDATWSNTEVPFVILSPLAIPAGSTLTIADGVTVKLDAGQRIEVPGTLVADGGTAGIVFTSLLDDDAVGDTNGDAAATAAAPGDWQGLVISGSGTILDRCTFRYAGSAAPYSGALMVTTAASPTITNNVFADNAGGTLADNRAAALGLAGAAAGVTVTGNTFYGNGVPMVVNGLVSIDGSNVFHFDDGFSVRTNTFNGIFMDGTSHAVTATTTWSNTEVPYMILNGTVLGINSGGTLTLGNDVVVKLGPGRIDVNNGGTLTQGTGTWFTSWRDDTLLGDSNGDGSATAPVKGDWAGINVCSPGCAWSPASNILYATNP